MKTGQLLFILCVVLLNMATVRAASVTNLDLTTAGTIASKNFSSSADSGLFKISLTKELSSQTYFFIHASGEGEIQINELQNDETTENHLCTGQFNVTCAFLLSDMEKLINSPAGFRFSAKSITSPQTALSVGAYVGDHLQLQENYRQTVVLKNIQQLPATVDVAQVTDSTKMRIQLKSHPVRKFSALNAYLNFQKDTFPTEDSHDEQFAHLDSFRSAFTAYNGDQYFCDSTNNKTCTYRLLLQTDGIGSFIVTVNTATNREEIQPQYRYVYYLLPSSIKSRLECQESTSLACQMQPLKTKMLKSY